MILSLLCLLPVAEASNRECTIGPTPERECTISAAPPSPPQSRLEPTQSEWGKHCEAVDREHIGDVYANVAKDGGNYK